MFTINHHRLRAIVSGSGRMEEKDDALNTTRSPPTAAAAKPHDDNDNGHHHNEDDNGPTNPLKHDDDFHYDPISVKEPEGMHTCKDTTMHHHHDKKQMGFSTGIR